MPLLDAAAAQLHVSAAPEIALLTERPQVLVRGQATVSNRHDVVEMKHNPDLGCRATAAQHAPVAIAIQNTKAQPIRRIASLLDWRWRELTGSWTCRA
jgi:hypothetical protein